MKIQDIEALPCPFCKSDKHIKFTESCSSGFYDVAPEIGCTNCGCKMVGAIVNFSDKSIDSTAFMERALIAAAPEMLKELERHCAICMMMHPDCEACELCGTRKVLKKARGEE